LIQYFYSAVFETVQPGDSVTLNCTIHTETCAGEHSVYWIRHGSGESHPGIIYTHGGRSDQCEKSPEAGSPPQSCVMVNDIKICTEVYPTAATIFLFSISFSQSLVICVSVDKTVLQQSMSKSVQPRDSVTLNCTIQTETCEGEHSVYWFRTQYRSDQCENSPEAGSPTQSCVYNLPKRMLSLSDAGTYYCAVDSCGEILFGNGTKLDVECGHSDDPQMRILVLLSVIRTGGLLCCLTIFIIIYTTRKYINLRQMLMDFLQ
uniref:Ig-like domain-containing protein n=1 Tax=Oncorhynchus kisutch TaxID=8019 RepID=A0A8C7CQ82_ONCKI